MIFPEYDIPTKMLWLSKVIIFQIYLFFAYQTGPDLFPNTQKILTQKGLRYRDYPLAFP